MGNLSVRGSAEYNTESAFGESSTTFGTVIQTVSTIDLSGLTIDAEEVPRISGRVGQGDALVRTGYNGSFTVELLLSGMGSTSAGSMTSSDLSTLLGVVLGTENSTMVGTTFDGTGSASAPGVAGGTIPNGSLIRAGALGDSGGNGQFAAVDNLSGGTLTLLTALAATPSNTDVCYGNLLVHPNHGGNATAFETVTTTRWDLKTANKQAHCWGCFPESISFSNLNTGQVPRVSITFRTARFSTSVSETFPIAGAADSKPGSPISGAGELWMGTVGSATRAVYNIRDFSFTVDNEVQGITGPGTGNLLQNIQSVCRVGMRASLSFTADAPANGTDTFTDLFDADTLVHVLWGGSQVDAKALGIYFPRCRFTSRPMQEGGSGLNRMRIDLEALTTDDVGTDLEAAPFVIAMG